MIDHLTGKYHLIHILVDRHQWVCVKQEWSSVLL